MRNAVLVTVLIVLALGCATTRMEVIPEKEGTTVKIWEKEQLMDHFQLDRDVTVIADQEPMKTRMDVIQEKKGATVNIWEKGQIVEDFRSDRDVIVIVDQESTKERKLVLFLDPTNINGKQRSYYVGPDAFADLQQYFVTTELSSFDK